MAKVRCARCGQLPPTPVGPRAALPFSAADPPSEVHQLPLALAGAFAVWHGRDALFGHPWAVALQGAVATGCRTNHGPTGPSGPSNIEVNG